MKEIMIDQNNREQIMQDPDSVEGSLQSQAEPNENYNPDLATTTVDQDLQYVENQPHPLQGGSTEPLPRLAIDITDEELTDGKKDSADDLIQARREKVDENISNQSPTAEQET